MPYEFHTTVPVHNGDGTSDDVWIQAELSWDQRTGIPQIDHFQCEDLDVMNFWTSGDAPSISMLIIDDALRLHNASSRMQ